MPLELRTACAADAKEIAALVNSAYRPAAGNAGWTHEASLVAGERTNIEQVLSLFHGQSVMLLLCLGPKIVACVHVQGRAPKACIGMLATAPDMQARGVGKQMLAHAETCATEHFNAALLEMSVLSARPELLAFYERRGYVLVGKEDKYPVSAGVGVPMIAGLHVLSLVKIPAPPAIMEP